MLGIFKISTNGPVAEIDNERPVILGMYNTLGGIDHYVVAYGYQYLDGRFGYIVHYGWDATGVMSDVFCWIDADWVNSYAALRFKHTHSYTVDTGRNIENDKRELQCEECGHRVVDDLYNVSGNTLISSRYSLTGSIIIPKEINGVNITTVGNGQFSILSNQNKVTSISFEEPSSITTIADYAFAESSELIKITFPTSLISIGNNAFEYCRKLGSGKNKVIFPDSLTTIGDYAFTYCIKLGSDGNNLYISDSVTSIGEFAFYNASYLEVVEFSSNSQLQTIETGTFQNCYSLKSINIPSSVTSIGVSAFKNCPLETIDLPPGLTEISTSTFELCNRLKTILIPSNVTKIGYLAFKNCTSLNSVIMDQSSQSKLRIIDQQAFSNCTSLKQITIPINVIQINSAAFMGCNNLEKITLPFVGKFLDGDTNTFFGYIFGDYQNNNDNNSIPEALKTVVVTNTTIMHSNSFTDCDNIENLTIQFIGETLSGTDNNYFGFIFGAPNNQFQQNYIPSSLVNLTISGEITTIAPFAFKNCSSLKKITIESTNSLTSINDRAFTGYSSLNSINLPDSITYMGSGVFSNCSSLTYLPIPRNVNYISPFMFENCTGLILVYIPDRITTIGESAFERCSKIYSVTLSNNLVTIETSAFESCYDLGGIKISTSVISMGSYVFQRCYSLTIYSEFETIPSGWSENWNISDCQVIWDYTTPIEYVLSNSECLSEGVIEYIQPSISSLMIGDTIIIKTDFFDHQFTITSFQYTATRGCYVYPVIIKNLLGDGTTVGSFYVRYEMSLLVFHDRMEIITSFILEGMIREEGFDHQTSEFKIIIYEISLLR